MNPKTREQLLEYCKPFNEELYSLIGKRFDWDKQLDDIATSKYDSLI